MNEIADITVEAPTVNVNGILVGGTLVILLLKM